MAEPTAAELKAQAAALQKKADEAQAAEDEAAKHPREPQVILEDFMRTVTLILGSHPKLEKLVAELDKVTAEKAPAAAPAPTAQNSTASPTAAPMN